MLRRKLNKPDLVDFAGILFTLTSIVYLPRGIFPDAFDRNAAPEFVFFSLSSIILAIAFTFKFQTSKYSKPLVYSIFGLIVFAFVSWILSGNLITGLTGDVGRYTGLSSLLSLLCIGLFGSSLDEKQVKKLYIYLAIGILSVELLGFLQQFKIIEIPTGGGTGSSLGNLDFLSAWIGTSFLVLTFILHKSKLGQIALLLIGSLNIWLLILIGAKQGLLDFILILIGFLGFKIFRYLPKLSLSTNVLTAFGTILFLIWCEFIYLVPISKMPFPGISGDANVNIRSDFWYAGASMFFHHLGFGVGPDNYGYYYEKYRSLSSVRNTEAVIANDAHSAMVQSFATLGIFAVISFVFLMICLINSFVVLAKHGEKSKELYLQLLFVIVYITNALVSPITLPNKFIFWIVVGTVIGKSNVVRDKGLRPIALKSFTFGSAFIIGFTSIGFTFASLNFFNAQSLAKDNKNPKYSYSAFLPCNMYFNLQAGLALSSKTPPEQITQLAIKNNPRCIDAVGSIASYYIDNGSYLKAKPYVYKLLDLVPGRHSTLVIAARYAIKTNDQYLIHTLGSLGLKLGLEK